MIEHPLPSLASSVRFDHILVGVQSGGTTVLPPPIGIVGKELNNKMYFFFKFTSPPLNLAPIAALYPLPWLVYPKAFVNNPKFLDAEQPIQITLSARPSLGPF